MAKKFDTFLESSEYYEIVFDVRDLTETTTHIYLSNRLPKLKEFPKILFNFPKLKYIELSFNEISEISEDILIFKNLEILNLNGNKIKSVPKKLKSCKFLNIKNQI
jgi:Leucine-rich repeat (LRR) protein